MTEPHDALDPLNPERLKKKQVQALRKSLNTDAKEKELRKKKKKDERNPDWGTWAKRYYNGTDILDGDSSETSESDDEKDEELKKLKAEAKKNEKEKRHQQKKKRRNKCLAIILCVVILLLLLLILAIALPLIFFVRKEQSGEAPRLPEPPTSEWSP